jgi:hypothetical protein
MVDVSQLMTCFCKTREVQSLYTNLLNDKELSQKEREDIVELIQCVTNCSNQIKRLCKGHNSPSDQNE